MQIHEIDPNEVVVPPRQRGVFDFKYIEELSQSIKNLGQLQPGVCRNGENGEVTLVIGECRLRACKQAQVKYRYYLKEDITDPAMLYECELMENLLRRPLTWREEVDAKDKLHELRQAQKGATSPGRRGGQSIEDTANELHESKGLVSEDLKLAAFAREVPEVANATTKAEAKKIVKKIEKEFQRHTSFQKAVEKQNQSQGGEVTMSAFEQRLIEYEKRVIHADFEELTLENKYHVVLFDPPWGVDFDKVALLSAEQTSYEDSKENFMEKFPKWLAKIYDLMAEDAHLYVFFGITHHEFVYKTLEDCGFATNRIPLIWHKQGAHRTRNPKIWPGRSYEPIAYARKGNKELERQGAPDVITTPQPTPKIKQSHPSAKHPAIYRELLLRSAHPGDRVLDPMAGSGMAGVAADSLRTDLALDWTLVEKSEDFRLLSIFNCNRGYWQLVDDLSGDDPDVVPTDEDFRKITPGTKEWVNYWRLHPEKQNEMIEFRRTQGDYNGR
jgi:ParB/RepB/Spo0J family partition protein